jgi:hypothetical protein
MEDFSMTWFDILKVEDEFTPFEEWAESLTIGSNDPIMNPFREMSSWVQETVNNMIEHGRGISHAGPPGKWQALRAQALQKMIDTYGSQVREFLAEKTPEAQQKGREFLEGIVNQASYAEFDEDNSDFIILKPNWLSVARNTWMLLRKTCVDEHSAERWADRGDNITAISLDYKSLEVFYEIGGRELEVCLHRNLLPSGDQLGFLVLAAENVDSWLKIWGEE